MSRTPSEPLFHRLVDDAAVFPPGLAPLDVAVREHLGRRAGAHAEHIGPLLVPATDAAGLARLALSDERTAAGPLEVALVARPGSPLEPVREAVSLLRDDPRVSVVGAELGWSAGWRTALDLDVPLAVEVATGPEQETALDDLAAAVDDDAPVTAKFRTGPTTTWPWPDEHTLAAFLDATVLRGLAFKLTGGLHHAVRGEYGQDGGGSMHGVLNVVLATHEALDGAESPELRDILARTNAELLSEQVARLTAVEAARTRATFTSFGCCGVTDPLTELAALGLIA